MNKKPVKRGNKSGESFLGCEIRALRQALTKTNQTILKRIAELKVTIMSKLSDYSERVNAAFEAINVSTDAISTSVSGVAGDVAELNRIISELQANPGELSPEDQALLDALEAKVGTLVAKTQGVADAIASLDAQTKPAPQP